MIREGADAWTSGIIYGAVVQAVMMYGLETWVMTPCIGRFWGGFHHRVVLRMTGRQPHIGRDGGWVYPLLEDTMTEAVLQEVETYVSCIYKKVAHFIATRPIMDLCLASERRPVQGWPSGGGSRTFCTWRGYIRQLKRKNGQRGEKMNGTD